MSLNEKLRGAVPLLLVGLSVVACAAQRSGVELKRTESYGGSVGAVFPSERALLAPGSAVLPPSAVDGSPNPMVATVQEASSLSDSSRPRSAPLSCGVHNPMPGGVAAGYAADTGLDLAGMKSPVFSIAAGTLDYSEKGHSLWTGPGDTDFAVRIELDEPIALSDGRTVTHVWYAHLLEVAFEQAEDAPVRRRVAAGEYLGLSGRANGMWHLHLGLLLDGKTSQAWGTFLLEDQVRGVLCGLKPKQRLPKQPTVSG